MPTDFWLFILQVRLILVSRKVGQARRIAFKNWPKDKGSFIGFCSRAMVCKMIKYSTTSNACHHDYGMIEYINCEALCDSLMCDENCRTFPVRKQTLWRFLYLMYVQPVILK